MVEGSWALGVLWRWGGGAGIAVLDIVKTSLEARPALE